MRVGIVAFLHESNTFIARPTTLDHFREGWLLSGADVRSQTIGTHHEVGGFFAGLDQEGITAVPIFAARAMPYGPLTAETFSKLLERMFDELERAGPLDGLLLAPHGATVSQEQPDADGFWLSEVRRRVGPGQPLVATLDPHGNLSPQMVDACDAIVAYRTNPHLDQYARGTEAARLIARSLRGEVRPTMAAAFPPLAINIERQLTSEPHLRPVYELADHMLARPRVMSNSILLGFPYADVAEMGSAALVVTDNDPQLAGELAYELGRALWDRRWDFVGQMVDIDTALERSTHLPGPVCLLDMGDNVGGGSPADGTWLAQAIQRRGIPRSFVCLYDPASVQQATASGVGSLVSMRLGGKTDDDHGPPLEGQFTVVSLHAGRFEEREPRHGGFTQCDQGPTVVVRSPQGLTVLLTSRRMPPFSLQQLISCGLDPSSFQLLVAKGVIAPVAAYSAVCRHLIRVNTPGCTTADIERLTYRHRRRPMFPFEGETCWPTPV